MEAFFERVQSLIDQCGTNKNDRAILAISACILEGIDTKLHILGILKRLDFDTGHIVIMLAGRSYDVPWVLDKATGRYRLTN